jgi:uncharacterized membrane protein YhaH (DUF805 family)
MPMINPFTLYFSTQGRISRTTWWIGITGLLIWNVVVFLILWSVLGSSLILNFGGRLVGFCFALLNIAATYHLAAKRFQDRNRPVRYAKIVAGGWALKALLDLVHITGAATSSNSLDTAFLLAGTAVGLWYFIEPGCMPGTVGPNDFGHDPLESDAR